MENIGDFVLLMADLGLLMVDSVLLMVDLGLLTADLVLLMANFGFVCVFFFFSLMFLVCMCSKFVCVLRFCLNCSRFVRFLFLFLCGFVYFSRFMDLIS